MVYGPSTTDQIGRRREARDVARPGRRGSCRRSCTPHRSRPRRRRRTSSRPSRPQPPVAVTSQAVGNGVICENSLYVIHVGSYDLLNVNVTSLGLVATTFLMLSGKRPGHVVVPVGRLRVQHVHEEHDVACRDGLTVGPLVVLERHGGGRVVVAVGRDTGQRERGVERGVVLPGEPEHVQRAVQQVLELAELLTLLYRGAHEREDVGRGRARRFRPAHRAAADLGPPRGDGAGACAARGPDQHQGQAREGDRPQRQCPAESHRAPGRIPFSPIALPLLCRPPR